MSDDPHDKEPQRSPFIADQRLLQLKLRPSDGQRALPFLRLEALPQKGLDGIGDQKSSSDSRWQVIPANERLKYLVGDGHMGRRRLLCVTAAAGIGKTMALEQLDATGGAFCGDRVVIWTHFSDLPGDWERYLDRPDDGKEFSFLVSRLKDLFGDARNEHGHSLPQRSGDEDAIRHWISVLLRCGQLILVVDGLDEVPQNDGIAKAKQLRKFLTQFPQCHCVVGGRPNAITQVLWRYLFSRSGKDDDETSDWEFALTDLFDDAQIRRALGPERYEQLQLLQGEINFSGRTIEVLRSLDVGTFASLQSVADVYWHGIRRSLEMDSRKEGLLTDSWMSPQQLLRLLAAIGITMLMWNQDPHFAVADDDLPDDLGKGLLVPDGDLADKAEVSIRTVDDLDELYRRLTIRLSRLNPDWEALSAPEQRKQTESQLHELVRLNTSYLECSLFRSEDPQRLNWRNATQRDFFAALWMTIGASEQERAWFHERIDVARDARDTSIAETWRFVCGMPDSAFSLQVKRSNRLWLDLIRPLYDSPNDKRNRNGRPTELMYRCWANLLRRAGFLSKPAWSEDDLMWATKDAQDFFDPNQNNELPDRVRCNDKYAWLLVGEFLSDYPKLRDQGESESIIRQDLEDHWCDCDSLTGKQVVIGHSAQRGNPVRTYELPYKFSLCGYQVTNRLYALFDSEHAGRFDDYQKCSPYLRGPAIHLSWYDSLMFSIWAHGFLPNEWIWEYASRSGSVNDSGEPSIWPWGDAEEILASKAWVFGNSDAPETGSGIKSDIGVHAHPVGLKPANEFGLHDTIGNVWEWCLNRYGSDVSRCLRGGAFVNETFYARCSYRSGLDPSGCYVGNGCRVARAHHP